MGILIAELGAGRLHEEPFQLAALCGLTGLEPTVQVHRVPPGLLGVVDDARFSPPQTLSTFLISVAEVRLEEALIRITGERAAVTVGFEPAAVAVRVDTVRAVDLTGGPRDVH